MGAGDYFNLIGNQFDEMVYNALAEIGIGLVMKKDGVYESKMKHKVSDFGHGGFKVEPNYNLSPQERIEFGKKNKAVVK